MNLATKRTFYVLLTGLALSTTFTAMAVPCSERLKAVVIVGPFSGGKPIARYARARSLSSIAVIPDPLPGGFDYIPQDHAKILVHRGDIAETTDALLQSGMSIESVLAGSEWNPIVADDLRHELARRGVSTRGNSVDGSTARRDKIDLFEALRDADVPHVEQFSAPDLPTLLKLYKGAGWEEAVLKPPRGCGTRDVRFCRSEDEIGRAFSAILTGELSVDLEVDQAAILQRRIHGPEAGVNGVRVGGKTYFTGIWEYEREPLPGGATIYVADRLVYRITPRIERAMARAKQVLDATELNYGFFHLEMIDTPDRGWLAFDLGARPPGGNLLELEAAATNRDPYELLLNSQLDPEAFRGLEETYRLRRHAAVVFISTKGGKRACHRLKPDLERMKERGEIQDYTFNFEEGTLLKPTRDSDTVVASIRIFAPTEEIRETRIGYLLQLQDLGAFER